MRDSVYRINLDIHTAGAQVQLTAKRGDVARRIYMTLYEDGKPWAHALDGMTRAVLTVVTPEDILISNDCDIRSDGTVVFDFTALTVKDLGVDECELTVYDAEGNVLTSPRFTILVDDTVFETGQIAGAAWKDAIDRAKAEIRETTDAIEEDVNDLKTQTVRFPSVSDMAAAAGDLKPGMQAVTLGRWAPRDGGARTYMIADTDETYSGDGSVRNPLAIELAEGLYAIPLIDDHVTALDIGLRRGIYGENPPYPNDLPRSVYADEDNISAQNSARFQKYIDNLPSFGIDEDTDAAGTFAPMRQIYFPEGTWGFRDPIVIDKCVTVFGVHRGTNSRGYMRDRMNANERDDNTAFSRLVFMGRELSFAPVSKGGTVASAFRAQKEGYQVIISPTPGDQPVDKTVSPQILQTSCLEYSFIYAGSRTTFEDLEIDGYDNYYWDYAETVKYNPNYDGPYTKETYKSLLATRDRNDPGAAHYIYHTFRKQRGISGITHATPQRDADGKIIVLSDGKLSLTWHGWMQVDSCDFYQWSRAGVRACVVDRIKNSTFAYNHFGIEMVSHDLWIMDVYISRGDIGIYSPTHTTTVSNSFIDFMAEFGVSATRTFDKMEIMGSGDTRWVKRTGYHFMGLLHVDYDLAIEFCLLGAYAAKTAASKFTIRGKLVNNGMLYCYPCTRIFEKNRLRSLENERKLTDAVENHADDLDSETLVWNNETNAWETAADPAETATLAYYHQHNDALFAAYAEMKNAHIVLEPTTLEYYGLDDVDEEEILRLAQQESIIPTSAFRAYLNAHPIGIVAQATSEDASGIVAYNEALKNAYLTFAYGIDPAGVTQNRIDNFYRLLGTSHINIEDVWHLHCQANVEVRCTEAKDWDHVDEYGNPERDANGNRITTYYQYPIAGFNYVRAYRGVVNCLFSKDDYYYLPDPTDPEKKRHIPLNMRKSFFQTRDRIYFEPTDRKLDGTKTASDQQYITDSRLDTPVAEQTTQRYITLKHAVTAEGLWTGSVSGYVNFSTQLHPVRDNGGIYSHTFTFDGLSDYSTQLGHSFTVPIYARDYQDAATTDQDPPVMIDGSAVALDAVNAGESIGVATITTEDGAGWVTLQPYKRYVGRILPVKF